MKYMLLTYGNQATWDAMTDEDFKSHASLIDELTGRACRPPRTVVTW